MLMKKYALGKLSFKTFLPPKTETLYSLSSSSVFSPSKQQYVNCLRIYFHLFGAYYLGVVFIDHMVILCNFLKVYQTVTYICLTT